MEKYILYNATSENLLEINEFFVEYTNDKIEKLYIKVINEPITNPEYGKVSIFVYFKNNVNYNDVVDIGDRVVDEFLNYLSYTMKIGFSKSISTYNNFEENLSINNSMIVKLKIACPLNQDTIDETLKNIAEKPLNVIFLEMYKSALNNNDDVARFMMLYSVLDFVISGTGQSRICKFAQQNSYPRSYRNTVKKRNECIFTYLRNKIGHTDDTVDFEDTKREMRNNVSKLADLLKKAIEFYS
ncbi:hypothetical protein PTI45_00317 [Paenibacillus nuruki]|uniref:Apea-like HEPN domain-containing protein n=1 Tax=Paenibacillus nuruki TaxID=1886670 RepID=A0A1E3L8V6_9BACL|nr:hypothetical protein [Paenibacillus nuruki]ODP30247.1 hypothetical protein PTI45_00317 [Paenibacillus nuruki]